ncbi:ribosome maturation factor RimP [Tessaracoccus antarcticus]|uniref:Ribosome maturation factor RimP n=1 Tax=Tessaracoccus antarcticus TaxID=2479848 RepID=A0A3M0G5D5_9ACTN|nr:ribosome maturation factor RimP [Tessaracoccus antarcticus]RMB59778.1 ribosome maturation factor RimP [Tessaracoccus antarcticus]
MHEQQLTELIAPILTWHGLELDELDVKPMGRRSLLRITVDGDGPDGTGPLLDDISAAASQISAALDVSDAVGASPFTLEVSSRGVSKPLTQAKHFRRNVGRLVTVTVGTSEITGRILSVTQDEVVLDVKGKEMSRQLAEIDKAVVQVEMNPPKAKTVDSSVDEAPESDGDEESESDEDEDEDAESDDETTDTDEEA